MVVEFFYFVVFGKDGVESVIFDGLNFGLVVELDAVEAQFGVEVLRVGEFQLVNFLLEL